MKTFKVILAMIFVLNISAAFAAQNDEASCDQIADSSRSAGTVNSDSSSPAAETGAVSN